MPAGLVPSPPGQRGGNAGITDEDAGVDWYVAKGDTVVLSTLRNGAGDTIFTVPTKPESDDLSCGHSVEVEGQGTTS